MPINLTPAGATFNSSGRYGQSLSGGTAEASGVLPSAAQFSVEASVKLGSTGAIQVAVGQVNAFWLGVTAAGLPTANYGFNSSNEQVITGSAAITDNQWHTLRLDISATGGSFYVDGVLVGNGAKTGTSSGINITNNPFGVRKFGGSASFGWQGEIDEVSVWSAAPTTQGSNYTPGLVSNSAANLRALYHLDGDVTDSAGAASAATALTLSGPSSGSVGVASSAFTVSANGTLAANVTVSLSDGGAGGTFTPTSVTLTSAATSGTFTYTPASTGAKTISFTNSGGLANPSDVTYTANAGATLVAVDNAAIYWSPYNWDTLAVGDFGVTTKSMQTSACGAYLKTRVTGTTQLLLNIDTSPLSGFSGANMPLVMWSIGNGPAQTAQLTSGATSLTLSSSLSTGTAYDVQVWLFGSVEGAGSRWGSAGVSPSNVLRVTGLTVDAGSTLSSHSMIQAKRGVFFADSIGEGTRAAGTTTQPADHGRSSPWFLAAALGCEMGIVGYGAQGWQSAGNGGVPALPSAFLLHSAGRSRSISGVDFVFVMEGFNGTTPQATVQSWIASARAAAGANAWIFVVNQPGGVGAAACTAAVNAYKAANPGDTRVASIDYSDTIATVEYSGPISTSTPSYGSIDKCHPLERSNGLLGAAIARKAQAAMGGAGTVTQLVVVAEMS